MRLTLEEKSRRHEEEAEQADPREELCTPMMATVTSEGWHRC